MSKPGPAGPPCADFEIIHEGHRVRYKRMRRSEDGRWVYYYHGPVEGCDEHVLVITGACEPLVASIVEQLRKAGPKVEVRIVEELDVSPIDFDLGPGRFLGARAGDEPASSCPIPYEPRKTAHVDR